jgi:hypothetical protein
MTLQRAVLAFVEATVSLKELTALRCFCSSSPNRSRAFVSLSFSFLPDKECAASDVDQLVAPVGGEDGRGREKNTK